MWFKHRAWILAAWLFSLGNIAGVWAAAQPGEPWHATTHAVLAVLSALGARHLMVRRREESRTEEPREPAIDEMREEIRELGERVDFAERLLARERASQYRDAPPR